MAWILSDNGNILVDCVEVYYYEHSGYSKICGSSACQGGITLVSGLPAEIGKREFENIVDQIANGSTSVYKISRENSPE